jgi:hypothetical protein
MGEPAKLQTSSELHVSGAENTELGTKKKSFWALRVTRPGIEPKDSAHLAHGRGELSTTESVSLS